MIKRLSTLVLITLTGLAQADPITLPNTLSNDTTANADEVQENFQALADEANEDDVRIADIEENFRVDESFNTAVGKRALKDIDSGVTNTAVGVEALENTTTGGFNTAIGYDALSINNVGSLNTAIGYNAGPGIDPGSNNLTNTTAIGASAMVNASNTIQLGNANVVAVITAGDLTAGGLDVGIGSVTAGSVSTDTLDASGVVSADAFNTTSDARLKEAIEPIASGLSLINDLNPVSYHRINNPGDDTEMGLLAQELAETLDKHGLTDSGMIHHAAPDAYMSVRYNDLLAPMIRAIQELDKQHSVAILAKDEQITSLQERISRQESEIARQQQTTFALLQAQQEQIARLESIIDTKQVAAR